MFLKTSEKLVEVFRNFRSLHYWHFILLKYENDLQIVVRDISLIQ